MGQKTNPIGLRLGIIKNWNSRWYSKGDFKDKLVEDIRVREFIRKRLGGAAISQIVIERPARSARITLHTARKQRKKRKEKKKNKKKI
jgi:small subunit ribosomal protein S3